MIGLPLPGHTVTITHLSTAETITADGFKKKTETRQDIQAIIDAPTAAEPRAGTALIATIDHVLYLPAGTAIEAADRFIIDGKTFEVEGEAVAITNPFTETTFYTEVKVRRWHG